VRDSDADRNTLAQQPERKRKRKQKYRAPTVPPGLVSVGEGASASVPPTASAQASCSDKIARWVAMGMEGALMRSLLAERCAPLRPSTVVVGRKYVRPHLQRALCCRVQRLLSPEQHPSMLCTAVKLHEGGMDAALGAQFTDLAFAWTRAHPAPELLSGVRGLPLLAASTAFQYSYLCTENLLGLWRRAAAACALDLPTGFDSEAPALRCALAKRIAGPAYHERLHELLTHPLLLSGYPQKKREDHEEETNLLADQQ
jgi:Adenosine-deaminase (editase) domain